MTTKDSINMLASERSRLYGLACNGMRGKTDILQRIREISTEMEALWEQRRLDRVGVREGIDLLVEGVYERTYGRGYDDAVAPPAVAEADERSSGAAAVIAA